MKAVQRFSGWLRGRLQSPKMSRIPQAESERVRLAILRAAAEELAVAGYAGLRVAAVADRVGKTPGAVYGRFPDKQSLAIATVREVRDRYLMPRVASAMNDQQGLSAIEALSRAIAEAANEDSCRPACCCSARCRAGHPAGTARRRSPATFQRFSGCSHAAFASGQSTGAIRQDIDAQRFVLATLGLPLAFVTIAGMFPGEASYADLEATLSPILTHGIRGKE